MATYRYLLADLRTNRVLAELPLRDVAYTTSLSAHGPFSATLDLGDDRVSRHGPIPASIPARTALYVDRDGALVWGGVVWTRRYDSDEPQLPLTGAEFSSYLDGHMVFTGIPGAASPDLVYTNVAMETIWAQLVGIAMSGLGSGIGLTPLTTGTPSGQLRSRTYIGGELRSVQQLIDDLADEEPGFEWANEVAYDAALIPGKYLRLSYPRRGRTAAASRLVWEYPGNLAGYQWDEDGAATANLMWGTGTGPANQPLGTASVNSTRLNLEGWPLLQGVLQGKQVRNLATLNTLTAAERARRDLPVVQPVLRLHPDREPTLGDWVVGDHARLIIDDPRRFPEGVQDRTVRVIDTTVQVGREGAESVSVAVDLVA